jgi:hypothetical protein
MCACHIKQNVPAALHSHVAEVAAAATHSLQLWVRQPLPLLSKPCMVLRQLVSNVNNYMHFPWHEEEGRKIRQHAMVPGMDTVIRVTIQHVTSWIVIMLS